MGDQRTRGGNYLSTDLARLDQVIGRWAAIQETIREHGMKIEMAIQAATPPAGDKPSTRQANAYRKSLTRALRHNRDLTDYAAAHVEKLVLSRSRYATTEQDNTGRFRAAEGSR